MFAIEVQRVFCAGHALRLPRGGVEPMHDHNFKVPVKIPCVQLDSLEIVIDFHPVEAALAAILEPWSNRNLNDIEPFKSKVNPSAERIAEQIGVGMMRAVEGARGVRVAEVRVTEAPGCIAIWIAD